MKVNLANEISALEVWREERHLSIESQVAGFKGNFFEEIAEFYRASNDYERVDALCDMLVFLINASNSINVLTDKEFELIPIAWKDGDKYKDCEHHLQNAIVLLIKCGAGCDDRLPASYLLSAIITLGYDPKKCLGETIKEICSRTGKYDEKVKKFIKDKGFYTYDEADKYFSNFVEECKGKVDNYDIYERDDCFEVILYHSNGKEETGKFVKWHKANYEECK